MASTEPATQASELEGPSDPPVHKRIPITRTPGNDRLSIPYMIRLPATILATSTCGFLLGAAHGGTTAALRFRAENAHRLPTSQVGWYLYHKSKNYNTMLGGIKEGFKMGVKVGFWSGAFFAMEEAVDRTRGAFVKRWVGFKERRRDERETRERLALGLPEEEVETQEDRDLGLARLEKENLWVQRDFVSTLIAALGTAGGFSVWNRFDIPAAARTATFGLRFGLVFGLAQDAVSLMRGRRLGYVETARKIIFGNKKDQGVDKMAAGA